MKISKLLTICLLTCCLIVSGNVFAQCFVGINPNISGRLNAPDGPEAASGQVGDTIYYFVNISLPLTNCPHINITGTMTLPDGTVVPLAGIPDMNPGDFYDFGGNYVATYVISAADLGQLPGAEANEVRSVVELEALAVRETQTQNATGTANYDTDVFSPPCVDITKEACGYSKVGDTITYTYTITNCSEPLDGLPGPDLVLTSLVDDKLGDLLALALAANGGSPILPWGGPPLVFTADYPVAEADEPGPITNVVTVNAEALDTGLGTSDTADATVELLHPSFTVDAACDEIVDGVAFFTVTFVNTGDVDLEINPLDMNIAPFTLPEEDADEVAVFVVQEDIQAVCGSGSATYTIAPLAEIPDAYCDLPNTIIPEPPSASATCTLETEPNFLVEKVCATPEAELPLRDGDTALYDIVITNSGDVPLYFIVNDPAAEPPLVDYMVGPIAPSGSETIPVSITVECTEFGEFDLHNEVVVEGYCEDQTFVGEKSADASCPYVCYGPPCVHIVKEACGYSKVDDTITYTYTITNCSEPVDGLPGLDLVMTGLFDDKLGDLLGLALAANGGSPILTWDGPPVVFTVDYLVAEADEPGPITNVVTVNAEVFDTGLGVSDTAEATVELLHPSFTVDVACDEIVDSVAFFTVTFVNTGDVDLEINPLDMNIAPFTLPEDDASQVAVFTVEEDVQAVCGSGTATYTIAPLAEIPDEYCDLPNIIIPEPPSASATCTVETEPNFLVEKVCATPEAELPLGDGDTAMYDIVISNTGDASLYFIVNDSAAEPPLVDYQVGPIDPNGTETISVSITVVCTGTGEFDLYNEVVVEGYCEDGTFVGEKSDDASCPYVCESPCDCRFTGGGVDTDNNWDHTLESGEMIRNGAGNLPDDIDRATFGGQAGAKTALPPQPYGEWTHNQQTGPSGSFVFHAGTASAPLGTEIYDIRCSDPGGCTPSGDPPSPAKQLDFDGIGTFKNLGRGRNAPTFEIDSANVSPEPRGNRSFGGTFHWFEVNVDDLGEPGSFNEGAPDSADCPSDGFGEKGTTALANCDCPDFYRITIYDGVSAEDVAWLDDEHTQIDPASLNRTDIIYVFYGYIDGGNLQIHHLTGYDQK